MAKFFGIISFILFLSTTLYGAPGELTQSQLERVKRFKTLIQEVDTKPFTETVSQIFQSPHPEGQLQILEAMAKTYVEIVREYDVAVLSTKKRLYQMILLNMAYFQFGGQEDSENPSHLNRLIQKKLHEYLSPEILKDPRFFKSLQQ